MVDCGATKCLQERKNIKKELLSWTKKIPLLIGLEEVSKVVLGKRLSRKVLDITHFEEGCRSKHTNCPDWVKDWEPQENCTFCEKKSKFFVVESPRHEEKELKPEDPPVSTEHGCGVVRSVRVGEMYPATGGEEDLRVDSRHRGDGGGGGGESPEQPLDLSLSSQKKRKGDDGGDRVRESSSSEPQASPTRSTHKNIQLKVPTLEGKFPSSKKRELPSGQKRMYTELELNAAVSEIRSGKIGTRRAAALYGIPRSTLRNKMCRLDLAESKGSPPLTTGLTSGHSASPCGRGVRGGQAPDTGGVSSESGTQDAWAQDDQEEERGVSNVRHKHDLGAGIDRPFGMPPLFYNSQYLLECERAFRAANPYAYDLKLPYLQDLIWRYAQERMEDSTSAVPTMQELKEYASRSRPYAAASTTDTMALDLQIPTLPSSPEYYLKGLNSSPLRGAEAQEADHVSPSTAQGNLPPVCMDSTLKDILTKTIISSEKRKGQNLPPQAPPPGPLTLSTPGSKHSEQESQPSLPSPSSQPVFPGGNPYDSFYMMPNGGYPCSNGHSTPASGSMYDPPPHKKQILSVKSLHHKGHSAPHRKVDLASSILPQEGGGGAEEDKPLKKTRPKRGQYRKYNHELLMEAVRAVQRGEMSVHRAGSYYGVPHSTLEYKVKERHLLRQKKPREPRKKALQLNGMAGGGGGGESSPVSLPPTESNPDNSQASCNKAVRSRNNGARAEVLDGEPPVLNEGSRSNGEKDAMAAAGSKYFGEVSSDQLQQATQSLQASLLLGSLGANGALPSLPPLPTAPFPLAFGWQNPLLGGSLPFPLPDAALAAASLYGAGGLGINTSASELLKKLQQKVQAESNGGGEGENGGEESRHQTPEASSTQA